MASKVQQEKAAKPSDELQKQLDLVFAILLRFLRRKLLIALTIPMAVGAFIVAPKYMPPVYQSEAVMLYRPLLRSDAVLGDEPDRESSRSRGQRLCEMLYSATRLEAIVLSEDLYPSTRAKLGPRDAVLSLREDASCRPGEANTIRVMFKGEEPDTVFHVTARLAENLIEIASLEGVDQAEKTLQFLEAEERQVASELRRKEQERAEFLQDNPEFASDSGTTSHSSSSSHAPVDRTATLRRQADRLRRQLNAPTEPAPTATAPPEPPRPRELTRESQQAIARAEASLAQARGRLNASRERFTPQHPDVIAAQRAVALAMNELESVKASATYVEPPPPPPTAAPATTSAADRARMRAQLAQLERALSRAQSAQPGSSSSTPQVDALASLEARWSELTRELETAQERHEQVAGRLFRASIIAKATKGGEESPLVMVDPPYRPNRPSARGARRTGLMAAAGVSMMWWMALLGLAFLDDRIYTAGDIERAGLSGLIHEQRRIKRRG